MKRIKKLLAFILVIATMLTMLTVMASATSLAYGAATVDADRLNVRSGPGTEYESKGTLANGAIVVVLEKTNDDWYKVNYRGLVGYVSTDYLTSVLVAENFTASGTVDGTGIRMRSGPSTSKSQVATVSDGTEVDVIGINNGWYKVVHDGKTGYIRSDLMSITGSSKSGATNGTKSTNKTLGEKIADFALQYVGYAYVYGAESPAQGFDCSGLVYYTYKQFGYKLTRTATQQYKNHGYTVSKDSLQAGDLVFFSSNGYSITHVGIYIGGGKFVHASTSKTGVIISDLSSSYYTRVWYGAKRIV